MNKHKTIEAYISLFENLSLEKISAMDGYVAEDVFFKDPFNEITSRRQLQKLLQKTLADVENPKFKVISLLEDKQAQSPCYILKWTFCGKVPVLGDWEVTGYSEICLNETGFVARHVDYWDASEYFYMKLPIIGALLRWIRKHLQVS